MEIVLVWITCIYSCCYGYNNS